MARFEVKRNAWLVGISGLAALMLSTAVWADDAATDPVAPDDSGTVLVDDGGPIDTKGEVQTFHEINPGAVDVTSVDDGIGSTDVTAVEDGSGDVTPVGDGTDVTAVDDGSGDVTPVVDGTDGTGEPAVDDSSGGVTAVEYVGPRVIYTMNPADCINCDVMRSNDAVALPGTAGHPVATATTVVAHDPSEQSADHCNGSAIAWLCEWKTGNSN